jgi:anti-sigma regulatory factor (Ser/Thr protein kinase)
LTGADVASFRHEALFYAAESQFVERVGAFLREGVHRGEPALVVVSDRKIGMLREELGPDAAAVRFADMAEVGANPARIIPAWLDFVAELEPTGTRFRGVGEPIWPDRTPDQLVECERHEALLNLAFADSAPWWLLCPYDTSALGTAVIDEARRNHPYLSNGEGGRASDVYRGLEDVAQPFAHPLPEPTGPTEELAFGDRELDMVRRFVEGNALAFGLSAERTDDLVLAANEVATNSVRHGGGRGTIRMWREPMAAVCEVSDPGRLDHPLVGRSRPSVDEASGFGLWIVHQVCDLVQIRTFPTGSVVRLHVTLA